MSEEFVEGANVFVNHPTESWIKGVVKRHQKKGKKTLFVIQPKGNASECTVAASELYPRNEGDLNSMTPNLLELVDLHEATLLDTVRARYHKDEIYTNMGNIVLSLNPFKWGIPWVQEDQMKRYIQQEDNLRPSPWVVADEAFRDMVETRRNHSILISGESGAGKTEASKTVMKYISKLSCSMTSDANVAKRAEQIAIKIQNSSPILEAFGNAKTINNDNSSRFGKFITLQFDGTGIIQGADIKNYLLEKSRLIQPGPNERSYHCFYQLMAGDPEFCKELMLTNAKEYQYLSAGDCIKVPSIDDVADYKEVREAMTTVGFSQEQQRNIYKIIGAICHLQNINFAENNNNESDITPATQHYMDKACKLLEIESSALGKAFTTKTIEAGNQVIVSNVNAIQASDGRDGFIKALYSAMFDWIVQRINDTIRSSTQQLYIGLLDIFGFELFEENSFEQLCINFANETLQHHYNEYNFKKDMEECRAEGIDVTSIKFNDNTPCIELVGGKNRREPGILGFLDDACNFRGSTEKSFLSGLHRSYEKDTTQFDDYKVDPRYRNDGFTVVHYAASVPYSIRDWLDKNRDLLSKTILDAIRSSKNTFFAKLVPDPVRVKNRLVTVSASFKLQLKELMAIINNTQPHWVRCIKSHSAKKPNMIQGQEVISQLRSSGVLETIKMRHEGYAIRIPLERFFKTFSIILKKKPSGSLADQCKAILDQMAFTPEMGQIGKTKFFGRVEPYRKLTAERKKALETTVTTLTKFARMRLAWKKVDAILWEVNREERERQEAERKKREAAERKKREEEERLRQEEEERVRKEEEARRRQEEEARKKREEEERRRKEEEERQRREEEERRRREEAERKRREEEHRQRMEFERQQRERLEAARKQREEEIRLVQEETARLLREKEEKHREEMARMERERAERNAAILREQLEIRQQREQERIAKLKQEQLNVEAQKKQRKRERAVRRKQERLSREKAKIEFERKRVQTIEAARAKFREEMEQQRQTDMNKMQRRFEDKMKVQQAQKRRKHRAKQALAQERKEKQQMRRFIQKITDYEKQLSSKERYEFEMAQKQRFDHEVERSSSMLESMEPLHISHAHLPEVSPSKNNPHLQQRHLASPPLSYTNSFYERVYEHSPRK